MFCPLRDFRASRVVREKIHSWLSRVRGDLLVKGKGHSKLFIGRSIGSTRGSNTSLPNPPKLKNDKYPMSGGWALIILASVLISVVMDAPLASGAYITVEDSEFVHMGYLSAGGYDALTLNGVEEGQTLSFMVEPQVTTGKFDIYLFTSKQFSGYEAGQSVPSSIKSWIKAYKVLDKVELPENNIVLVVDNNNLTQDGADAMGQLNYTLTMKVTEEPFLKKNLMLIAGGLMLVIIMAVALVVIVRRDKEPSMPIGPSGISSSLSTTSSHAPPTPPGLGGGTFSAPPPRPPSSTGRNNGPNYSPTVRGGKPDANPPPPPPSTWSKKQGPGSELAHTQTPPAPPHPPSSSGGRPSAPMPDKRITVKCPGCGIHIKHDPSMETITCSSCGLAGSMG